MISVSRAVLFPGQGAHDLNMLEAMERAPGFADRYDVVREALGFCPRSRLARGDCEVLRQNAVSSLLTVLASAVAFDRFCKQYGRPDAYAGFSVGQWMALHAAECIDFEQLVRIVKLRADLMDACIAGRPTGMLAVIGVAEDAVRAICDEAARQDQVLTISNVNAPRQYTVAGDEDALDIAESRLRELKPRRLVRLNVAGAWHTPLLGAAAEELERRLAAFELRLPAQPVADNVTGGMLPDEPRELRLRLAEHVAAPVQWQACVKSLIAAGAAELVEVGYGSMLTKFGPFIDRSVAHRAFLDE